MRPDECVRYSSSLLSPSLRSWVGERNSLEAKDQRQMRIDIYVIVFTLAIYRKMPHTVHESK